MKHSIIAAIVALPLAACSTAQIQSAQSLISTGIQAACTDLMAANKLNPASPVAPWVTGACGTASAVAALVQNSDTLVWLGKLQEQSAAPVAIVPPAPAS